MVGHFSGVEFITSILGVCIVVFPSHLSRESSEALKTVFLMFIERSFRALILASNFYSYADMLSVGLSVDVCSDVF